MTQEACEHTGRLPVPIARRDAIVPKADRKQTPSPPPPAPQSVCRPVIFHHVQQHATDVVRNITPSTTLTALLCALSVRWTYFKPGLKIFSRRPVVVSSQTQESREIEVCRERRPGTLCPWQRTAGPSTPPRSQRSLRWGLSPRRHQLRKTRKRVSFLCISKWYIGTLSFIIWATLFTSHENMVNSINMVRYRLMVRVIQLTY